MQTAERLLAEPLPQRWAHTQGVAARSRLLASTLGDRAQLLEAAAWLHDIGYSPDLADTGFHPLDGARYLRNVEHADDLVCQLVAHHSYAIVEAEHRALRKILEDEFELPPTDLLDALIYCDMTTDPSGAPTSVDDRLTDICTRYGDDHVVSQSMRTAAQGLVEAVQRVSARISKRHA